MIAASTIQSQAMVLLIVGAGVVLLMLALRALGLYLASTHPEPEPNKAAASAASLATAPAGERDPEIVAVIAAATAAVIEQPFRIVAVSEPKKPSIESLMQVWSWEGRRQIYSSHRVR